MAEPICQPVTEPTADPSGGNIKQTAHLRARKAEVVKDTPFIGIATAGVAALAAACWMLQRPSIVDAAHVWTSAAEPSSCGAAAFLTYEHGRLAAVDWVDRTAGRLHTRVVETQSHVVDVTIDLRANETAAHSSAVISTIGEPGEPMKVARDLGERAIYWSPRIPSSIEQAIARARVLDLPLSRIPGASLYNDSSANITVERVDPRD